jgi:WSC domain
MQRSFISIFALGTVLAVTASPYQVPATRRGVVSISDYESIGCYTEATSTRALTGLSYFDDAMTVEKCAAACAGFDYFGIEYHREVCQINHSY